MSTPYTGTYMILRVPSYYIGMLNAPQPDAVRDGNGYALQFDTRAAAGAEAERIIAAYYNGGPYRLEHGEAGRPMYEVRHYDPKWDREVR